MTHPKNAHAAKPAASLKPVRTTFTFNGWTMVDYRQGSGHTTFVLVHGIGVASRYYSRLADSLSTSATVHTVELPGFGGAPEPKQSMSVSDQAELLAAFLRARNIEDPVLVGHSMGAQWVLEVAWLHPDLTARLALMGPVVNPAKRTVRQQALRLFQHFLTDRPSVNARILFDYIRCGPRWYLKTLPHMMDYPTLERTAALGERYRSAGLGLPQVLVVRGARDAIAPHSWAALLADSAPNGRLLEVAGHMHVVQFFGAAEVASGLRRLASAQHGVRPS